MRDEGLLKVCRLQNTAQNGDMPTESIVVIEECYYSIIGASTQRVYLALGADHRFDKLVRCHNTLTPKTGDYVILEDGTQYQIDIAKEVVGQDDMDLTLVKLEDYYDVIYTEPATSDQNGSD